LFIAAANDDILVGTITGLCVWRHALGISTWICQPTGR